MSKHLYISEKPSVAQEFAKALKKNFKKNDGYMESDDTIVTWCVGHLVTMSYPESYNPAYKKWSLDTIPFVPTEFKYEVIPAVSKQFSTVKRLLNRDDVSRIYVCTDSGREGEYIYRLVDQMAKVSDTKEKRRVWIDSQTEEEILRGIKTAKDLKEYDNLSDAAYLRAMEDYLMGINFSRVLTLKYGRSLNTFLKNDKHSAISAGRVMTCVLGMVVRREREIRAFVKTPFYRVIAGLMMSDRPFDGEFKAIEGSKYYNSPKLYKENGFKDIDGAKELIGGLVLKEPDYENIIENGRNTYKTETDGLSAELVSIERKKELKNAPLLYNLAELQNECSKMFKISPDQTLKYVQEMYEKKLVTYPRTDARVLSTAAAKEIEKNIKGLTGLPSLGVFANEALNLGKYKTIAKTKYVNDKQITDHYAIIPTGQGFGNLNGLSPLAKKIYELIVRRFLCIFYPPAAYQKIALVTKIDTERFFSNFRILMEEGYLKVAGLSGGTSKKEDVQEDKQDSKQEDRKESKLEDSQDSKLVNRLEEQDTESEKGQEGKNKKPIEKDEEESYGIEFFEEAKKLKKGMMLPVSHFLIKEGETAPPKRYSSGSMILAMENAGQLIEDEELRAQIKGSGIGTSATRAEILNKLVNIDYLALNKKTQIITPALMGEMIYDIVNSSIKALLNADLTASWEKGLTYVSEGTITKDEYMQKLEGFIVRMTNGVKNLNNQSMLDHYFYEVAKNYK